MQTSRLLGTLVGAILLILVVATGSDVGGAPTAPLSEATPEPITGTPAVAAESDPPPRDPFTPYAIGGPEAEWKLSDLTPAEQAVAQRGLTTTGWSATHNAFANAVLERAQQAAASAAAAQLGVDNLPGTGVVP